jgi:hypothetical protein
LIFKERIVPYNHIPRGLPMTQVIPMRLTEETGDDLFEDLPPDERVVKLLEREFPYLCNDIGMLVGRPFTLIWDPTVGTASTDCKAEVRLSPHFFLEGHRDVGYGTAYHECGHIQYSPYGVTLLQRAEKDGGPTRRYIMNIILDRKDDMRTVEEAPGFAETLRARLLYICTMTRREEARAVLQRLRGKCDEQALTILLRHFKPRDSYEDFFFAAKWHRRPRFKEVHRIMRKYLNRRRLLAASPECLLWMAERIHERLGEAPENKDGEAARHFAARMQLALAIERGGDKKLSAGLAHALNKMVQQHLALLRSSGLQGLLRQLKTIGITHPGPISTGVKQTVPVKTVPPDGRYAAACQSLLTDVESYVSSLVRRLRRLDNPSEFVIYGQDEGELDLSEAGRIATGLPGYHLEVVTERDLDADLHLALDCSGSMQGDKVQVAKKIGMVFSQAVQALQPACQGRVWAFSSEAIYDFGPCCNTSGFVMVEGEASNSDTHMLRIVGSQLARSHKRRRVLLVLCDDGPDNMEEAKKLSHQLLARGIIVIHLLVGVHGTPSIYPFELLYASIEECLEEFGDLIEVIIRNLR